MGELADELFPDLEARLRHRAGPLPPPRPGDWLAEHTEKGQTFRQFLADPAGRDTAQSILHLYLLGHFDGVREQVVARVQEYLALFFVAPVSVRRLPLSDVPAWARRRHPEWGGKQLLTDFVLRDLLGREAPDDALACLALTARDLWLGGGWNFVFGQADLCGRAAVCSLHRLGWPGKGEREFRACLRRALRVAAHEVGHALGLRHCVASRCLMNGFNSRGELDRTPLHPCPVCLRKLLWCRRAEPVSYLRGLAEFCSGQGLAEAAWYERAAAALEG